MRQFVALVNSINPMIYSNLPYWYGANAVATQDERAQFTHVDFDVNNTIGELSFLAIICFIKTMVVTENLLNYIDFTYFSGRRLSHIFSIYELI